MKKFFLILILCAILPVFTSIKASVDRLSGRILLQVELHGEAWYVNPDNGKRYFLGRPNDAFQIMRELSLGISNKDFDNLNNKSKKRLSGKIILKVEDYGKAYYINPDNLILYSLGSPIEAWHIMKNLGLGISNADIQSIPMVNDDPDRDGLNSIQEKQYGTNPYNSDSDNDGYPDGVEVSNGYNPLGVGKININDCQENWLCGSWTDCNDGQQSRICNDQNHCNSVAHKPVTSQVCNTDITCVPNWTCGNWSVCENNMQTRLCQDNNGCQDLTNKPTVNRDCIQLKSNTALMFENISYASSNNPHTNMIFASFYHDPNDNSNHGTRMTRLTLDSDNTYQQVSRGSGETVMIVTVMHYNKGVKEQIVDIIVDNHPLKVYFPTEDPYIVTGETYYIAKDGSTYYMLEGGLGRFMSPEEAFQEYNIARKAE